MIDTRNYPTTRQAILDYFSKNQHATSEQLSRAMQVTKADIRYHINILIKMGIIEAISVRPKLGLGRPTYVYALVKTEQRQNALRLANALLNSLHENVKEETLQRAALQMAGNDRPMGLGLTQRLMAAIKRLNSLEYRARWEAHKSSPHVIIDHCPYRSLIDEHPEICIMDRFLLSYLLQEKVRQIVKLGLNTQEEYYCLFQVDIDR